MQRNISSPAISPWISMKLISQMQMHCCEKSQVLQGLCACVISVCILHILRTVFRKTSKELWEESICVCWYLFIPERDRALLFHLYLHPTEDWWETANLQMFCCMLMQAISLALSSCSLARASCDHHHQHLFWDLGPESWVLSFYCFTVTACFIQKVRSME